MIPGFLGFKDWQGCVALTRLDSDGWTDGVTRFAMHPYPTYPDRGRCSPEASAALWELVIMHTLLLTQNHGQWQKCLIPTQPDCLSTFVSFDLGTALPGGTDREIRGRSHGQHCRYEERIPRQLRDGLLGG